MHIANIHIHIRLFIWPVRCLICRAHSDKARAISLRFPKERKRIRNELSILTMDRDVYKYFTKLIVSPDGLRLIKSMNLNVIHTVSSFKSFYNDMALTKNTDERITTTTTKLFFKIQKRTSFNRLKFLSKPNSSILYIPLK